MEKMKHGAERVKCAHDLCKCMIDKDESKYCSPHCEEGKDMVELVCNCKHPGCATL